MKKRFMGLGVGFLTTLSLVFVVYGQTAAPKTATTATAAAKPAVQTSAAATAAVKQKEVIDYYCMECHSKAAHFGGLALESLDITHVGQNRKEWEKVVKKLRAGMMPPVGNE